MREKGCLKLSERGARSEGLLGEQSESSGKVKCVITWVTGGKMRILPYLMQPNRSDGKYEGKCCSGWFTC